MHAWLVHELDQTPEMAKAKTKLRQQLTGVLSSHRTVRPAQVTTRGPRPPSWWTTDEEEQAETLASLGIKL